VHNNYRLVEKALNDIYPLQAPLIEPKPWVLVSPDAGANKKVLGLAKHFGGKEVVRADKLRDTKNGEIKETIVFTEDLSGKVAIICDDIASRAGTFKALAKVLKEKNAEAIYLIVSHYEDSADRRSLKESGIDGVFTTNSIRDVNSDDFLVQFNVFDLMK
jgi:ribose-phosphate pyrophosphokinase